MKLVYFSKLLRKLEKGEVPDGALDIEQKIAQLTEVGHWLDERRDENSQMLKYSIEACKMECCKLLIRAFKLGPVIKAEELSFEQFERMVLRQAIIDALEDAYRKYTEIAAIHKEGGP